MLKPVSLLVGAMMLTSTLASAKADDNGALSVLALMEPNKPTVLVDVTGLEVHLKGDTVTTDVKNSSLTKTVFVQGKSSIASVTYKDGKRVDYQVKNGTVICTRTAARDLPKPQAKTPQKPANPAAPTSSQMKEQNVPASRLHVGDAVYAIHGATETVFDGDATARVASLSPLTLNLITKTLHNKAYPKGKNAPISDDFDSGVLVLTGTGNRSGTVAFITVVKPNSVKFTRLNN